MSQFNLIDNRPERLLNHIHSHGVKVLARGPVFKGLLTSNSVNVLDRNSLMVFLTIIIMN